MVAPNEEFDDSERKAINIELNEQAAEGIYSNLVLVSHSPTEFVIDFARILPGPPKGKVQARIIMTPQHIKSLVATLQDNMAKFERNFGPVQPPPNPGGPPSEFNF
ncbi:MAG: DUF3467 domain-containing protein [Fibrobacteria bacterium]|nr:DUF3467 domain-containing protein [Fibrobacteria bacterium]